ncbi:hypothetical protein P4H39_32160, partial [Paenibacillus lautus]|uniref:hypothetical protein n=1 Tax=Paenibacillus lautus TaxID=1401 RepID=UPI002DB57C78
RSEVETYVLNNESGEMEKASEVGPFGTIPTTSLNVWFDDFEVYVNGVKHVDVYPRFEWKGGALVKNDSIGVAIPQGWQIISGQNSCQTQFKYYSNPNDSWTYGSDCGGRPASEQTYGMSWQNLSAPIHTGDYPNFIYKGTAFFRVKKTSSSANTRFVGSYAHDASEKATSSYSVGFNWGFISFQLNGSSSSSNKIDTAGFSKNITG